jgi:hypothetical protein
LSTGKNPFMPLMNDKLLNRADHKYTVVCWVDFHYILVKEAIGERYIIVKELKILKLLEWRLCIMQVRGKDITF